MDDQWHRRPESAAGRLSRRAVAGSVAALAAGAASWAGSARSMPLLLRGIAINGIAGGGLVQWDQGEASFELYTVRLRENDVALFLSGHVAWVDAGWEGTGLRLESSAIEAYGPAPGQEETAREVRGRMRVNGEDEYPFVLRAVDGGPLGSGEDRVALAVGDVADAGVDSGFSYEAEGPVVTGGLQRVLYEAVMPDPATPNAGTPTC